MAADCGKHQVQIKSKIFWSHCKSLILTSCRGIGNARLDVITSGAHLQAWLEAAFGNAKKTFSKRLSSCALCGHPVQWCTSFIGINHNHKGKGQKSKNGCVFHDDWWDLCRKTKVLLNRWRQNFNDSFCYLN